MLFAGVGYGTYWYAVGRHYESTNDAYLGADSVTIAPKVRATWPRSAVGDNQRVKAGDVLARIDPRDYQTALDSAQADLENAQATAANIDAQIKEQQATIAQAQAAVRRHLFSEQEFKRYNDLASTGAGSAQRQQQAQSDLGQRPRRAALTAQQAHIDVLQTQRKQADATIAAKQAALDQAKINLAQTTLTAPVDGVVGDRTVRVGQLVQPGTRLMTVVPTAERLPRRQLQGDADRPWCRARASPSTSIPSPARPSRARSTASRPAPARSSRCCRRRTRPATSPRSCSACRSRSCSTRKIRCADQLRPGLIVTATVDTRTNRRTPQRRR